MDAAATCAVERQLKELREAANKAKLAQRNYDIKAAVSVHKSAGAKRMVGTNISSSFHPVWISVVLLLDLF